MSRKDGRRVLVVALPPEAVERLRAAQGSSRGRRLTDTLRRIVENSLRSGGAPPGPRPVATGGKVLHLQLPPAIRASLAALARSSGCAEADLVRGCLAVAPDDPSRT